MVIVPTEAPKTLEEMVELALKLIDEGNSAIKLDERFRDLVLLLGNTGAGKTTVSLLLADTGALECYEAGDGRLIRDKKEAIGEASIVSKTLFPSLVIDEATQTAFYDLPGFCDTRYEAIEIANAFFIKKVAEHARSVKFIFVVNYSSLKSGESRTDFKTFLEQTVAFIRNPRKFAPSFAIVATKASKSKSSEQIINGITKFLEGTKKRLPEVITDDVTRSGAEAIINALLSKDSHGYNRIAHFGRPAEEGNLLDLEDVLKDKEDIRRVVYENIIYTKTDDSDFGLSVSPRAKHMTVQIADRMNQKITEVMKGIGQKVSHGYEAKIKGSHLTEIGLYLNIQKKFENELKQLREHSSSSRDKFFKIFHQIMQLLGAKDLLKEESKELEQIRGNLEFLDDIGGKKFSARILDWMNPLVTSLESFKAVSAERAQLFIMEMDKRFQEVCKNLDAAFQKGLQEKFNAKSPPIQLLKKYSDIVTQMNAELHRATTVNGFLQQLVSSVQSLGLNVSTSALNPLPTDVHFGMANIHVIPWVRPFENLEGKVNQYRYAMSMKCENEEQQAKLKKDYEQQKQLLDQQMKNNDQKYKEAMERQSADAKRERENHEKLLTLLTQKSEDDKKLFTEMNERAIEAQNKMIEKFQEDAREERKNAEKNMQRILDAQNKRNTCSIQ